MKHKYFIERAHKIFVHYKTQYNGHFTLLGNILNASEAQKKKYKELDDLLLYHSIIMEKIFDEVKEGVDNVETGKFESDAMNSKYHVETVIILQLVWLYVCMIHIFKLSNIDTLKTDNAFVGFNEEETRKNIDFTIPKQQSFLIDSYKITNDSLEVLNAYWKKNNDKKTKKTFLEKIKRLFNDLHLLNDEINTESEVFDPKVQTNLYVYTHELVEPKQLNEKYKWDFFTQQILDKIILFTKKFYFQDYVFLRCNKFLTK